MRRALFGLLWLSAAAAQPVDDWGAVGDESGFAPVPAPASVVEPSAGFWSAEGAVRFDLGARAFHLDDAPLAKARTSLDTSLERSGEHLRVKLGFHLEYDAAYWTDAHLLRDGEGGEADTADYRSWLRPSEQVISVVEPGFELAFGRQIVAYGEGDLLSPLDLVNPRDLREPGQVELDDLRLPVLASRAAVFLGSHRLEALVVHEAEYGQRPAPLAELSPFREPLLRRSGVETLVGERPVSYDQREARFDWENQGYLGRWLYRGPGADLGLYAASVKDRLGVFAIPALSDFLSSAPILVPVSHPRYTAYGASVALTQGAWLVKGEAIAELERPFTAGELDSPLPTIEMKRATLFTGMLGLTYAGPADTQVAAELTRGIFADEPPDLLWAPDAEVLALRLRHLTWDHRLVLSLTTLVLGLDLRQGLVTRATAEWELADGLHASAGGVLYVEPTGDEPSPTSGLGDRGRLLLGLRWDFSTPIPDLP